MQNQKRKISLDEIGYRLMDSWDKFENELIDERRAAVNVKHAAAIVGTFKVKALINDFNGVKSDIHDIFGDSDQKRINGRSPLLDELTKE